MIKTNKELGEELRALKKEILDIKEKTIESMDRRLKDVEKFVVFMHLKRENE